MRQRSKSIEKSNKDKDNERAILKRENLRLDGNFLCERIRMIRLKRLGSRKWNQLACDKQGRTNEQILLFLPKKINVFRKSICGPGFGTAYIDGEGERTSVLEAAEMIFFPLDSVKHCTLDIMTNRK